MQSGKYSLYLKAWKANDKEAQYQNMVDMWKDETSSENILVRKYEYPTLSHGLDAYSSPFVFRSPLSAGTCPTLDFMELFDVRPYPTAAQVTDGEPCERVFNLLRSTYILRKRRAGSSLLSYSHSMNPEAPDRNLLGVYTAPPSPLSNSLFLWRSERLPALAAYTGT
jgi:hypothetical protein